MCFQLETRSPPTFSNVQWGILLSVGEPTNVLLVIWHLMTVLACSCHLVFSACLGRAFCYATLLPICWNLSLEHMPAEHQFAYRHNCNGLSIDQMKELETDDVPLHTIEVIHAYWQDKRQKRGMPLIRHFQVSIYFCLLFIYFWLLFLAFYFLVVI